jgi:NIMA-interacting peptidyl-prolyl cis-trans isomerase 1
MKQSRANPGYYYYYHMDTAVSTWDPPIMDQVTMASIPVPMEEDNPVVTPTPMEHHQLAAAPEPSSHKHGREEDATTADITTIEDEAHGSKRRKTSASEAPSNAATSSSSSSSDGPKEVRVLHILKKHKGSRRPSSWRNPKITATKEEAHEELEGLLEILQEEEGNAQELRATFEELARTESDCSSAKRGGDLGFFGRKKMQPAFEAASFGLKKGELTKNIVDTSSGSHIILRIG